MGSLGAMRYSISALIVAAAIGLLGGCGSSTSSRSHAAAAPSAGQGSSTPITSAAFRAVLLYDLKHGTHPVPAAVAQKAADCGIKKFLSQGINTEADFQNPHNAAIEHQDGIECARQTGYRP